MRIASTGIKGNIGSVLVRRGAIPLECDITDEKDVRRALKSASPDIVINPASKSKPDYCENNTEDALQVNYVGTVILATEAKKLNIPIVAMSTDYIFSGKFAWTEAGITFPGPYKENERRIFPLNYYGMTKFAMEAAMDAFDNVKIVRTSNVFWREDKRATNYLDKLYEKDKVMVPTFQHRSFMHIEHFAESLEKYCEVFSKMPKILHIAGSKTITWYEFIKAFADTVEVPKSLSEKLKPLYIPDKGYVPRPKRAGLKTDLSAKLGLPQYDYLDGMKIL